MLTPFLGELGSASIARAVVAAAGHKGCALVESDAQLARALGQGGFQALLLTDSKRVRERPEFTIVREPPPAVDVLVCVGRGAELRDASEDATAAAQLIRKWVAGLAPGGRLIMVDRIDGGLLGARASCSREDLCAALLAARLRDIAQAAPRAGTVVTHARVGE